MSDDAGVPSVAPWRSGTSHAIALNNAICHIPNNTNIIPSFRGDLHDPFGGIPYNLGFAVCGFLGFFAAFVMLRKGMILDSWRKKQGADDERDRELSMSTAQRVRVQYPRWTSIFYGNQTLEFSPSGTSIVDFSPPEEFNRRHSGTSSSTLYSYTGYDVGIVPWTRSPNHPHPLTFIQWLTNSLLARDDFLRQRSGPAAIEYLRFQRHLIMYTAVICILSIGVILPINYTGGLQPAANDSFPRTTIANLNTEKNDVWVHVAFTILLFPMGLLTMRSYGMKFGFSGNWKKTVKTLMFDGLNPRVTTDDRVRKHFEEAFPDCDVTAINLTLDVAELQLLDEELSRIQAAIKYYDQRRSASDRSDGATTENEIRGYLCGCCSQTGDAIDYYKNKRAKLERAIQEEILSWKKTNTIFFVTFATEDQAAKVYEHFRSYGHYKCNTSTSAVLRTKYWTVNFAPSPAFVCWENLSSSGMWWWTQLLLKNILILTVLGLLITPAMYFKALQIPNWNWGSTIRSHPMLAKFFIGVLPSLIFYSVAGATPVMVYYLVRWIGYHTRAKELRVEMNYVYGYLLTAILIFPSVALTSATLYELRDIKWA